MSLHTKGVIAKRVDRRPVKLHKDRPGQLDWIEVESVLVHVPGNERPYFSVTADIWYGSTNPLGRSGHRRKRQGLEADAGGCCHDDVLRLFPHLAPVVKLHLSDDEGVPMHAVANGWHFYSGQGYANDYGQFEGRHRSRQVTAKHLQIDEDDLPEGMDRDQFAAFCESLRPLWREQAAQALAVIKEAKGTKR